MLAGIGVSILVWSRIAKRGERLLLISSLHAMAALFMATLGLVVFGRRKRRSLSSSF